MQGGCRGLDCVVCDIMQSFSYLLSSCRNHALIVNFSQFV